MVNSLIILKKLVVLFVFIYIGFFTYKKNWVNEESSAAVAKLVTYIFNPALAISTAIGHTSRPPSHMILQDAILALIMFGSMIAISPIIAMILRVPKMDNDFVLIMLTFGNTAFLGIPLIEALYGHQYTIYLIVYILFFNLLFYSLGEYLFKRRAGDKTPFKFKDLCNVGIISSLAALALFATGYEPPALVVDIFSSLGSTCITLSMIVTGFAIAKVKLDHVLSDIRSIAFTFIRMLAIPCAVALLIRSVSLPFDPTLLGIMVIMYAVPNASLPVISCHIYKIEDNTLSRAYALTTISALITMPLVCILL